MKNTETKFGCISRAFHWISALAIIGVLALGMYMEGLDPTPDKFELYGIHKAIAIFILGFMVARVIWRLMSIPPKPVDGTSKKAKILASLGHLGLYGLSFTMIFSGWGMSSAGGHAVSFFGFFSLPAIVEKNKEIGSIAHGIHEYAGQFLAMLIVLHVLAALYHHFIKKDTVLKRMIKD